jgi:hypothetical protein
MLYKTRKLPADKSEAIAPCKEMPVINCFVKSIPELLLALAA